MNTLYGLSNKPRDSLAVRNPRRTGSRCRTGWRHILHHCRIRRPARRRRTDCHRSRCTGCSRTCLPCRCVTDGLIFATRGWRWRAQALTVCASCRQCRMYCTVVICTASRCGLTRLMGPLRSTEDAGVVCSAVVRMSRRNG